MDIIGEAVSLQRQQRRQIKACFYLQGTGSTVKSYKDSPAAHILQIYTLPSPGHRRSDHLLPLELSLKSWVWTICGCLWGMKFILALSALARALTPHFILTVDITLNSCNGKWKKQVFHLPDIKTFFSFFCYDDLKIKPVCLKGNTGWNHVLTTWVRWSTYWHQRHKAHCRPPLCRYAHPRGR